MDATDSRELAWRDVNDVATAPARLAEIAGAHPEYADAIGRHPQAYPELVAWAGQVRAVQMPVVEQSGTGTLPSTAVTGAPSRLGRAAWSLAAALVLAPTLLGGIWMALDWSGYYQWQERMSLPLFGSRVHLLEVASLLGSVAALIGCFAVHTVGRRVGAVAVWALAALLMLCQFLGLWMLSRNIVIGGLIVLLLLIAWMLSRPIRGLGYLALPIFVVLSAATVLLANVVVSNSFGASVFTVVFGLVVPVIAVILALVLSRVSERRRERAASAAASALPQANTSAAAVGTNTMALLALIFAFLPTGPLCLIFGYVGLSQLKRSGESGRGMAIAGIVLGYIWIAGVLFAIVAFGLMAGVLSSLR